MQKFSRGSSGFSLVETLVVIGLSSIITLSVTYALVSSIDGMSHIKNLNLAEDAAQLVSGMLYDPNYCGLHFNGKTVPATMGTVIESNVIFKDMLTAASLGTTELFKAGQNYQRALVVNKISLSVESKVGTNRYIGALTMDFKSAVQNGMVSQFARTVHLFMQTDAASKIINCSQSANSSVVASQYVRGQMYGNCHADLGPSFNIVSSDPPVWPMLTCPNSGPLGTPTCDVGFTTVVTSVTQMNSVDSAAMASVPHLADPKDDLRRVIGTYANGDTYQIVWACVKN